MQDLDHKFIADPLAEKREAALRSIEAERARKVQSGYALVVPYAQLDNQSTVVGVARLIVLGTLFLAPSLLLANHVWGLW